LAFGARIEVLFKFQRRFFRDDGNKGPTMQAKRMPNPTGRKNEPTDPEPKQKKPYTLPKFTVLTPDQARVQLTERALPGDAAAQQLLGTASQRRRRGSNEQGSIPGKAKAAPKK
jgi:hypothetical protein